MGWFVFFPDVAAGDEGWVGDFVVDLFDIDAGGALFDFFDEEVDAAVVGVGHGVSALIEEDLDESGAHACALTGPLEHGGVDDGVPHEGFLVVGAVEDPVGVSGHAEHGEVLVGVVGFPPFEGVGALREAGGGLAADVGA